MLENQRDAYILRSFHADVNDEEVHKEVAELRVLWMKYGKSVGPLPMSTLLGIAAKYQQVDPLIDEVKDTPVEMPKVRRKPGRPKKESVPA